MCIAGMLFIALQQSCCNATMPCRQVIRYQLPLFALFGGFLPVFRHLIGYFISFWSKYMIVYRICWQFGIMQGVRAGATPGTVRYIYTEIHRSGKLTVNHSGN